MRDESTTDSSSGLSASPVPYWPADLPREIVVPETNLWHNLEVSAARFPTKPLVIFFGRAFSFCEIRSQAEAIAGWLQQEAGVRKGHRVLLCMQNCPQFMVACYGILRAGAVVVPINPMNKAEELKHYILDTKASVAIYGSELDGEIESANARLTGDQRLKHRLAAHYEEACIHDHDDPADAPPAWILARHELAPGVVHWQDALSRAHVLDAVCSRADDLAIMPYTSGTTGLPKGCMHSHRTVMHTAVGGGRWLSIGPECTVLAVLPLFHVTGMVYGMHGPIYNGSTVIMMPRWDREIAGRLISHYRITHWTNISTMIVDLLSSPSAAKFDLSSLNCINGGGAAMPQAIAQRLQDLYGLQYVEGYGLTETMAPTHSNPVGRPKQQCLGIPFFNTDARVIDPETLQELGPEEKGEIIVHGPQVFLGYWHNPGATASSFVELNGKRYFRTGDLGRMDREGYFFLTDRLKRMINASGFKVWPAEVENILYKHSAILETCVVGIHDAYRGETVKAVVVLRDEAKGRVTESDIINWAKENMAAYKYPRVVEFADALPKSGTGKIMWRTVQEGASLRNE